MTELNLTATNKEQERILAYLQENVSEVLAEKINNGVIIEKNGKRLINKKTLSGFMKYAADEARKLAEKGAAYACIDDPIVYGWAIHYFEEDSIEGTLYNEDGSEYKPTPKPAPKPTKPIEKPAPKPTNKQASIFDMFDVTQEHEEQPNEEDVEPAQEEIKKPKPKQGNSIYRQYMSLQRKYPESIIAYRLVTSTKCLAKTP